MKYDIRNQIVYSTDFSQMNSPAYYGYVIHLLCLQGTATFIYNDKPFTLQSGNIAIFSRPDHLSQLKSNDVEVAYLAAPDEMLHSLLPQNNYSITGCISLFSDPIIPVSKEDAHRFQDDIQRIRERIPDADSPFYRETMGSMLLTMMYDLFAFHVRATESQSITNRTGYIVQRFMILIGGEQIRRHREVAYYAEQLHITPKYLSDTVRRATGTGALGHINRSLVIIIKQLLDNSDLSIVQIAEELHFESLSYFSRFCTKHLGVPPSEYRKSKK
jgi:AraC-like DNA-binding protein